MSHSYSSNRVHVTFSTKNRAKSISQDLQPRLWAYMAGIARNKGFEAIVVGGVQDHVHALIVVPPVLPLAKAIQLIKGNSSRWLSETGEAGNAFAWQEGYGAFSVSASQTDAVIRYIREQARHHARRSFEDEFLELLKRHSLACDPRYVLG